MSELDEFKKLKEQNGFDIGGREYRFSPMPFKVGKKIFTYMTTIANEIESGSLGFIDTPKFENEIEPKLIQYTLVDGFKLSTLESHFDEHPSDYAQFVVMSLQGFSAPFLPESVMSSASTQEESQTLTLKKPM